MPEAFARSFQMIAIWSVCNFHHFQISRIPILHEDAIGGWFRSLQQLAQHPLRWEWLLRRHSDSISQFLILLQVCSWCPPNNTVTDANEERRVWVCGYVANVKTDRTHIRMPSATQHKSNRDSMLFLLFFFLAFNFDAVIRNDSEMKGRFGMTGAHEWWIMEQPNNKKGAQAHFRARIFNI